MAHCFDTVYTVITWLSILIILFIVTSFAFILYACAWQFNSLFKIYVMLTLIDSVVGS